MIRQVLTRSKSLKQWGLFKRSVRGFTGEKDQTQEENALKQELNLTGVHFDEIDKIMCDNVFEPLTSYYPKLDVDSNRISVPHEGHNVMVVQPWVSYANFGEATDPDLQLEECVSLGNTIHNWQVVGKQIIFSNHINRKTVFGPQVFEDLKDTILSHQGVSAVFFGVELLSGVQIATLEKELSMSVYDRFTVVLNIFRQHARTKEAKLQLALAELPYVKSHLREIHESSEYSSSMESLKLLIGGAGEKYYHRRLAILKRRENKLKYLLEQVKKQRDLTKSHRRKQHLPIVSIVGYTNSGKTSLVKYLTEDENLVPRDQLFATLDVTAHNGQLPSNKSVLYLDTVGFLSRVPKLLVDGFSATLKDVQDSDMIVHVLDVGHPDHKIQYQTVIKALETLEVPKKLLNTKLTIGNKLDLIKTERAPESLPSCDLKVSITNNINMQELVARLDEQLLSNLNHETTTIRVENGGQKYTWLRKNSTLLNCEVDHDDSNYLICRVIMNPAMLGRWHKLYGTEGVLSNVDAFKRRERTSATSSQQVRLED